MAESQTTGERFEAKAILDDEANTAVDADLATPDMGPFPVEKAYRIDLAAAVEAGRLARDVLPKPAISDDQTRITVRAAVLLESPKNFQVQPLA